ncbi:MAG: ATP-binding protein [Myxococcota bacterium]
MRFALRLNSELAPRVEGAARAVGALPAGGTDADVVFGDDLQALPTAGPRTFLVQPRDAWQQAYRRRPSLGLLDADGNLELEVRWALRPRTPVEAPIATTADGCAVLSGSRIARFNEAFRALVGGGELMERRLSELVHPDDRWQLQPLIAGQMRHAYLQLLTGSGSRLQARASATPSSDGTNWVLIRELERGALRPQVLLADRLASVGTLAAGMAHELNNPLSFVLNHLQLIKEALETPQPSSLGQFREGVDVAIEGAKRMARIVRDLRTFSRGDGSAVRGAVIDVEPALRSAINLCEHELLHRCTLHVDIGPMPPVVINPSRLSQVFINLLVNASQALAESEDAQVRVLARTDEQGWATIAIEDTGAGIRSEDIAHIFEPFFTTRAAFEGTGLGLSISRRLITDAGGEIRVESTLGKGSTFTVRLPPSSRKPNAVEVRPTPDVPPAPARVLVIDDEPLIGRAMVRALRGHAVQTVTNGDDALEQLKRESFDVVFCDVMMPDRSGIQVYESIVAERPHYRERFVFMTGGAFTADTHEYLKATDRLVIDKPFDLRELRRIVVRVSAAAAESSRSE